MKTRLRTMTARKLARVKLRVAGGVLLVVAVGLGAIALNIMSYPERLAPVVAAFAVAGSLFLGMAAALCFHAAGDIQG